MIDFIKKHFYKLFWTILIGRYIVLYTNNLDLYADEAQYYYWSQNLDLGFYSKPPLIALIIALSTKIFGTSEFGIRAMAPLFHAATALIIKKISEDFYNKNTAKLTAIAYLTIPAIGLSSIIISTDVLLLTFWTLSIYIFLKMINSDKKLKLTIILGMVLGLGMLSKYNMFMLWVAGFIYLVITKNLKTHFWYCALASLVALVIFLPNLYWNYMNDFVSFKHTQDISKLGNSSINLGKMLEFLLGQFAMIGPILLGVIIYNIAVERRKLYKDSLFIISVITLIPFIILSLVSGANINWASIAYPGLIILGISYNNTKLLKHAIGFNIIISILFVVLVHINFKGFDPFYRIKGWKNFGKVISEAFYETEAEYLLVDERKLMSWALYYTEIPNNSIFKIKDYTDTKDHYDLTKTFDKDIIGNMIVTKDCNRNYGKLIKKFKTFQSLKSPEICVFIYE